MTQKTILTLPNAKYDIEKLNDIVCKICIIKCKKGPITLKKKATTFLYIFLPLSAKFYRCSCNICHILHVCRGLITLALEQ